MAVKLGQNSVKIQVSPSRQTNFYVTNYIKIGSQITIGLNRSYQMGNIRFIYIRIVFLVDVEYELSFV